MVSIRTIHLPGAIIIMIVMIIMMIVVIIMWIDGTMLHVLAMFTRELVLTGVRGQEEGGNNSIGSGRKH